MTRTMADAINPNNIPVGKFALVAGYVDGPRSQWPAAGWARHAGSILVRIAVFASTNAGVVLDVETGDATPAQAPGWVRMRRAAGGDPTVYCNLALWPTVRAAFHSANIAEPHYWVAGYPGGGAVIPAGAIAHQYADPATSGGQWDLSVVADFWPGVDQGGSVTAPNSQEDDLVVATLMGGNRFRMPDGHDRNIMDCFFDLSQRLITLQSGQTSLQGALTADEATLVGLLQGVDSDTKAGVLQVVAAFAAIPAGGTLDVRAFAASLAPVLAPLLPPETPPAVLGEAVVAALEAHLATAPPAGGTP